MKKAKNHRSKVKTLPAHQLPFEDSLVLMILNKCEKIVHDLHKFNPNMLKINLSTLDKDMELLTPRHPDYGRIKSLVLNIKCSYAQKQGRYEDALQKIQQAILVQNNYKVDKVDVAKTLLNKSIVVNRLVDKDSVKYNEEESVQCFNMAIQLIENRSKYRVTNKQHIKFNQITLSLFYYYTNELNSFQIKKQSVILYKKAYKIALQSLGAQHHLTCSLKNTLANRKKERKKERRAITQSSKMEQSINSKVTIVKPSKNKRLKELKYRSFFKVYGYASESKSRQKEKSQLQASQMKQLDEITKIYNPKKTNVYLPKLTKNKRNIRDILMSRTENHSENLMPTTHKINQAKLQSRASQMQEKLSAIQILNPKSVDPKQKPQIQIQAKEDERKVVEERPKQFFEDPSKEQKIKKGEQSNCSIM